MPPPLLMALNDYVQRSLLVIIYHILSTEHSHTHSPSLHTTTYKLYRTTSCYHPCTDTIPTWSALSLSDLAPLDKIILYPLRCQHWTRQIQTERDSHEATLHVLTTVLKATHPKWLCFLLDWHTLLIEHAVPTELSRTWHDCVSELDSGYTCPNTCNHSY